ncbi:restriction endonuclease subunit S [Candidatus Pacearchaeota archaeon]|jgi:hypothetical protein|nr:restriction endonuclease subunit S [Candidatus Pacearchaeota archaeon]
MITKRLTISDFLSENQEDELFEFSSILDFSGGNSGLTEEFIYNNQPNDIGETIPILSSATQSTNSMGQISRYAKPKNKKLKIYKGPCVLVARNGYAGTMTYIPKGEFTINDHAYIITPKKDWVDKIDLRWFVYQYQELFYNLVTSKSDNATFNKEYAEKQKMIVPNTSQQSNQINKKIALENSMKKVYELIYLIRHLITNTSMPIESKNERVEIGNVFLFKGGNSGLTEEFTYNNQASTEEDKVSILSGATLKKNSMGYISRNSRINGKKIKIFEGTYILVARKGFNAGTITHIDNLEFTLNDDAYIITPKKDWVDKIDLRWFVYQYQELFYNLVTSKSDNATFNKEYAERQKIVIPEKSFQDDITKKLFKLDALLDRLENISMQIEMIKSSNILLY